MVLKPASALVFVAAIAGASATPSVDVTTTRSLSASVAGASATPDDVAATLTSILDADQSDFQFFASGDELPHYDPGTAPVIESGDVTESYNNTASTPWDINRPAQSTGDLIIMHLASDANVTHGTLPGGPNGETAVTLVNSLGDAATATIRISSWYWIATGSNSSGTVQVTPSATEQWFAAAVRVPAGEFDPANPIEYGDTNYGTTGSPSCPTFTATLANGRPMFFGGVDADAVTGAPSNWTLITDTADRGAANIGICTRDAASTAEESVTSGTLGGVNDGWAAVSYMVNAPLAADGRTALDVANTNPDLDVDTDYGWQFRVESGGSVGDGFKAQYKHIEGTNVWTDVTTSSSVVKVYATSDFSNGADVPEFIGGSGTYIDDNNAALDTSGTLTLTSELGSGESFEGHLNFRIVSGDVANDDTIQLRIVGDDDSEFDTYTWVPTITVVKAAGEIDFVAAIAGASATPGIDVTTTRAILASIAGASATPAIIAAVTRAVLANIQGASTTPDDVTASLVTMISFAASIQGASTTPDIAVLVSRALSAAISGASTTPAAAVTTTRLLTAAIAGLSATPAAQASFLRALAASIAGASSTPSVAAVITLALVASVSGASATPAITFNIVRALTAAVLGESATPSITATMQGVIALVASISGASATPDINAITTHLLSASIVGQSAVSEAAGHLVRTLAAAIAGASATPDITASLVALVSFVAAVQGASVTPSVAATVGRVLSAIISGQSSTPDVQLTTARLLLAGIQGTSVTPDDLIMYLTGLGVITDPEIVTLTPYRTALSLTPKRILLSSTTYRTLNAI